MKKILSLTLVLLMLASLLCGCGASSKSIAMDYAAPEEAMEAEAPAAAAGNSLTTSDTDAAMAVPENRKWIITVDMFAETEDLDALLAAVEENITSLNGYVENRNIYNGSNYASRRYRSANLTVRIPAEDVDSFTQEMSGISNVVRSNKNLEDVTLRYTDTENRVKALETEQARLLELMEMAETMADLLEIEARLTDVRYELENYSSQLRSYDNRIDYATIYLDIEEVQEYTPVEEETFWQRISGGFLSSLKGVGEGAVDVLVWIIVSSPYLVVIGGIAVAFVIGLKRGRKRRLTRKQKPVQQEKKDEE